MLKIQFEGNDYYWSKDKIEMTSEEHNYWDEVSDLLDKPIEIYLDFVLENEFKDFKYKSFGSFIQLNTGHQNVSIDLRKNETYRITIVEDGKKSSAKLREINLKNLPLYQDNLNITREGVLSN